MKLITTLCLALLWVGIAHAGPGIEFDMEKLDLGSVSIGELATGVFHFTNTGDEPLIISECKAPCGCTVPVCPKNLILPGETGEIEVSYNKTAAAGTFSKTFTVYTNAIPSSVVLSIFGTVVD